MLIRFFILYALMLLTGSINACAQKQYEQFKRIVDSAFMAHPAATGIAVSVTGKDGKTWSYAVGKDDKNTKTTLSAGQPVLIASNTKTYIAATVLKLCEQKKLAITDTIGKHLLATTLSKLAADGYETKKITIANLLSHTSGISDYVNDDYFAFVNTHKQYKWTRNEQIDRALTYKPLAAPGDTFSYADVNYLLLTEIIEQVTHKPFYTAVRELLDYKGTGLNETWFTTLEHEPRHTARAAHQYWNKYAWDAYGIDPSWDLYGGGGIMATPADVALFFKQLFEGEIIKDTDVLAMMYTAVPCKTKTNYCLGLRKLDMGGLTGYYHGGFWGTDAIYFPELKTAICIVVLEKSERDIAGELCRAMTEVIRKEER